MTKIIVNAQYIFINFMSIPVEFKLYGTHEVNKKYLEKKNCKICHLVGFYLIYAIADIYLKC